MSGLVTRGLGQPAQPLVLFGLGLALGPATGLFAGARSFDVPAAPPSIAADRGRQIAPSFQQPQPVPPDPDCEIGSTARDPKIADAARSRPADAARRTHKPTSPTRTR